jgi:dihydrofolate reductase
MSLDGYIALKNDDISWLSMVEREGVDYGYNAYTKDVDTYIVGRKTYDVVKSLCNGEFPQSKQYQCYVITRSNPKDEDGVHFFNGHISELIKRLKQETGGTIYCDGGGQIVHLLMEDNLIDEYIISIIPILLGEGKRLFIGGTLPIKLDAQSCTRYESGLIQLRYLRSTSAT